MSPAPFGGCSRFPMHGQTYMQALPPSLLKCLNFLPPSGPVPLPVTEGHQPPDLCCLEDHDLYVPYAVENTFLQSLGRCSRSFKSPSSPTFLWSSLAAGANPTCDSCHFRACVLHPAQFLAAQEFAQPGHSSLPCFGVHTLGAALI